MQERQVELESALRVAGHDLIPIVWTSGRRVWRSGSLMIAMCREAIGVIVQDGTGLRVFLADGREITVEQLLCEYPSLRDGVSSL